MCVGLHPTTKSKQKDKPLQQRKTQTNHRNHKSHDEKQQQSQENENFPHQEPRKPPSIGLSPNPPPTPNGKPIIPPKQDLTAYIDHSIDLLDALDHVPRDILRGKDFVRIIFHILVFGASRARFAIDVEFEAHVIATGLIAAVTVVQVLLV